ALTGHVPSKRQEYLKIVPMCSPTDVKSTLVRRLDFSRHLFKRPNERSDVYILSHVLLPGDSTIAAEKRWSNYLPKGLNILIAGHHGSFTSTGQDLLMKLPEL